MRKTDMSDVGRQQFDMSEPEGKKAAGKIWTEEMNICIEDENVIEERKQICSGKSIMVTHTYRKNPEGPQGKADIFATMGHTRLQVEA